MSTAITRKVTEEMLDLSAAVIQYVEKHTMHRSIRDQVVRSIASIGANYTEAQDASSKKDFLNKIYIAKKEASETVYWLKLLKKLGDTSEEMEYFEDKTQRLVMMLQKIINSSRSQSLNGKG